MAVEANANDSLSEIAEVLADVLQRLRARQSSPSSAHVAESLLDCGYRRSGNSR